MFSTRMLSFDGISEIAWLLISKEELNYGHIIVIFINDIFFLQEIPNCPVELIAGGYYKGKDFREVKKI